MGHSKILWPRDASFARAESSLSIIQADGGADFTSDGLEPLHSDVGHDFCLRGR
jgi:hypothetical protein